MSTSSQGKGKGKWQKVKESKQEEQRALVNSLPFALPASPRYAVFKSEHPANDRPRLSKAAQANLAKAMESRQLINIPHSGAVTHAAIANPRYVAGSDMPRFAAIRFAKAVSPSHAAELEELFRDCQSKGLVGKKTAAHGEEFQQIWLGLWQKYAREPNFTASSRTTNTKLDAAIRRLMRSVDGAFSRIAQQLRRIDEPVYDRSRPLHRHILHRALDNINNNAEPTVKAMHEYMGMNPDRSNTSLSRIGGLGSVLAVSTSTGGGTAYHYDVGDDELVYSTIVVLKTGGTLYLPEVGYQIQVKVGDAVSFLASEQFHKLDVEEDGEQRVYTLWTDRSSRKKAMDPNSSITVPKDSNSGRDCIVAQEPEEDQ